MTASRNPDSSRAADGDEVGYVPFDPEAASLFFHPGGSRYEGAALIGDSSKPLGQPATTKGL